MLQVRATDEQLKAMFYPGVPTPIPGRSFGGKGFRSTWQEAIVGLGLALERSTDSQENYTGDTAAPMIRDLGVGLAMGFSPREVIAAQLGKAESPMNGGHPGLGGRDLHWGDLQRGLLVATAPLAISASTTTGLALANKRRNQKRLVVNFIGEGGSSQGDWYEALNFAGVRRLPMLFVVENNRVALGTAVERQSAIDLFADKAVAVGIPSFSVDGADPEELWAATKACRDFALSDEGGAILLGVEAMRGCGHAHHDDDRYRKIEGDRATGYADHEAYELWSQREPLRSYPQKLIELGLLSATELSALQSKAEHDAARTRAEVEAGPWAPTQGLGLGVQPGEDAHDHEQRAQEREKNWAWAKVGGATPLAQPLDEDGWTMRAAIEEALCVAAERYGPDFLMLGEDLEYGGAFGVTQRLKARGFGAALVDTPLAESVIIGAAVGAAMSGLRVVAEIQFNAFVAHAFSQIVNNVATTYWRYGQKVPLVIRIPVGAGLAGGPYHALSNEAWFAQAPGLKMLYPATPSDAYHGLLEALAGDAPVLFFEHLTLYPPAGRTTAFGFGVRQTVDTSKSSKILGCAELQREGKDLSIVTWGAMVHFAKRAAEALAEKGLSVEVLDLRSLWPLDLDSAVRSVQKTGALIVLQESQHRGGYGHYLASRILERAFMDLQAPPLVLGAMDILPPFAPHLEAAYLPSVQGITEAAAALIRERDRNRRA
jgi:2-oxoisovalerate dehydrogenase E1 component